MREERGTRNRAFVDVSGDHEEQRRPKRKKVDLDETSAENNGFVAFLNGDAEAEAVVDSVGKIPGASTAGSYSAVKEFSHSDVLLIKKDDALAGNSGSFSEQSLVFSTTTPPYIANQSSEAPLSKVDQAFTSSDTSSKADHSATVDNHISSAKKDNNASKESVSHEELENQNNCMNTLKSQNTSLKRKKYCISDFTEKGSAKKIRLDFSSSRNLVDVNGGLTESAGEFSEATESAGEFSEATVSAMVNDYLSSTEKDNTEFKVSTSHEELENHNDCKSTLKPENTSMKRKKDSMPDFTEKGSEKKVRLDFSSRKNLVDVNGGFIEENLSVRSISSTISIEVNKKVLNDNFKAESSLPPSPITGVIDCIVGKSNGENGRLNSLNESGTTFSFQTSNNNVTKEIPKCEIGFDCSQRSVDVDADSPTQRKERIASSFSIAEEEEKKEVQEIGSMRLERSVTGRAGKKLLVLDLNGLLCDIVNDYYSNYRVEKKVGGKPFFKRPFCDDFLKFCFDNFHIGIWSSRRKYNVDSALDYLMGEYRHKLLFCWDQSKCTYTGERTIENHHKPLVLKELKKLWNKEESDLPWEKGDFSPSNTLLLDDSPYKALCNPPHTAIFPYPYQYTDARDNSLGPGGDIRVYLEQLLLSDDVQRFVEEHPFGQPAITASDQNWYFYHQIIKSNSTHLS